MTLCKNPVLDRQRDILGVIPRIDLESGVKIVCNRVRERLGLAEQTPTVHSSPRKIEPQNAISQIDL